MVWKYVINFHYFRNYAHWLELQALYFEIFVVAYFGRYFATRFSVLNFSVLNVWPQYEILSTRSEAEFKELEPRLKFKPWLKYGWFHLKLYLNFQD